MVVGRKKEKSKENNMASSNSISRIFRKGTFFGMMIFVAAFPILFLNETRSMTHYQALEKNIRNAASHDTTSDKEVNLEKNRILPWAFRLFSFFMMFFGLAIILKMPSQMPAPIPFIGNIAETGVGIVAFLISASLCFLTISAAWLFVRPFLSIALIFVAIAIAAGMKLLPKRQKE
jgi:hypothetical protein